tara:strand:+ start:50 stop:622 length:573 start_codon:yes stop_codon:yes gene_type:complete
MLKNNFFIFVIFIFVVSCQPVEVIDDIVFDYSQFTKVSLIAETKNIKNLYEPKYSENYIDYSLSKSPITYLNQWLNANVNTFGNENLLEINVLNSSLKKSEIKNNELNKYKEKTIFLFEINYLVEFILYDNNNSILASVIVEANRSTTSGKYISIQESEKIIDYLIFNSLRDFSNKAQELIKIHLKNFIL